MRTATLLAALAGVSACTSSGLDSHESPTGDKGTETTPWGYPERPTFEDPESPEGPQNPQEDGRIGDARETPSHLVYQIRTGDVVASPVDAWAFDAPLFDRDILFQHVSWTGGNLRVRLAPGMQGYVQQDLCGITPTLDQQGFFGTLDIDFAEDEKLSLGLPFRTTEWHLSGELDLITRQLSDVELKVWASVDDLVLLLGYADADALCAPYDHLQEFACRVQADAYTLMPLTLWFPEADRVTTPSDFEIERVVEDCGDPGGEGNGNPQSDEDDHQGEISDRG